MNYLLFIYETNLKKLDAINPIAIASKMLMAN